MSYLVTWPVLYVFSYDLVSAPVIGSDVENPRLQLNCLNKCMNALLYRSSTISWWTARVAMHVKITL